MVTNVQILEYEKLRISILHSLEERLRKNGTMTGNDIIDAFDIEPEIDTIWVRYYDPTKPSPELYETELELSSFKETES